MDKCIYFKFTKNCVVVVCLYIDDIVIIGINIKGINKIKKYLTSQLKMKDLGKVDTILGIKTRKDSGGFALCESHYIDKLLSKFNHLDINEYNTPFHAFIKLIENSEKSISQLDYASAIGSLI